jgi:hypothetical protein
MAVTDKFRDRKDLSYSTSGNRQWRERGQLMKQSDSTSKKKLPDKTFKV